MLSSVRACVRHRVPRHGQRQSRIYQDDGIAYATGLIGGRVSLAGPLSENLITLGVGLELPPGTRHWLNEVATADIGIFMPGAQTTPLPSPLPDKKVEPAG
jgi:hypothetical protein